MFPSLHDTLRRVPNLQTRGHRQFVTVQKQGQSPIQMSEGQVPSIASDAHLPPSNAAYCGPNRHPSTKQDTAAAAQMGWKTSPSEPRASRKPSACTALRTPRRAEHGTPDAWHRRAPCEQTPLASSTLLPRAHRPARPYTLPTLQVWRTTENQTKHIRVLRLSTPEPSRTGPSAADCLSRSPV